MELQRGICSLCSESGRVFTSSNAAEFLKYLPRILYENFLPESEFQKIKDFLKICTICCYKLELSSDLKKKMTRNTENSDISDISKLQCHFCKSTKCVMKVKDDWKFFIQRTEGFLKLTDFPVNICYRCVFYFDTIFNFKTKLLYKFPQLAVSTKPQKSNQKQNDTPKRKSLSNSPPSSRKRKIFNDCFTYLQPLCNETYHVDVKLKRDPKMYKKIAYVNLQDTKKIKETPRVRPKIKIKLKQPSKKTERYRQHRSESVENNKISQPYVKLCKSEEIPSKVHTDRQKRRSLSEEKPSEDIEETPKAANATVLAPKRRVSLYVELNEAEVENDNEAETINENETEAVNENEAETEVQSKPDVDNQPVSEEINNIVEKYIKDTTFNDTNKLELLQEIEENGIEKNLESNEDINTEDSKEELNKKIDEPQPEEAEKEEEGCVPSNESPSSPQESPPKGDNGDGSDSDGSDKCHDNSNVEKDSLTGSERKKKRVTFSDEINT